MDAVCWLLDQGTPAQDITWIRPRDSWILNRSYFQPGDGVLRTFEGVVLHLEAVAECDSIEQVYERLEDRQVVLRIDRSTRPSMQKGATASVGEVDEMRRIENVIRLGHVERIDLPSDPGVRVSRLQYLVNCPSMCTYSCARCKSGLKSRGVR
jgi:hypothetical protein